MGKGATLIQGAMFIDFDKCSRSYVYSPWHVLLPYDNRVGSGVGDGDFSIMQWGLLSDCYKVNPIGQWVKILVIIMGFVDRLEQGFASTLQTIPVWKNFTGKTLFSLCNDPVRDCSVLQPKSDMGFPMHPRFQQSFSIVCPPRCTCFFAPIPCLIVCNVAYYVRMPKRFYDLALEEIWKNWSNQ